MAEPHNAAVRPVIFVGPTMPLALASAILPDADFRPPLQRGGLDDIAPGTLVGIIDGLLAETLAISPGEIREAIARGVIVYGAASMGALRAAEVPQIIGVGRVFQMYRNGVIERDDEVVVMVNPETFAPWTVPMVNVRYAVERLVRSGTLRMDDGQAIIEAGLALHYGERTYPNILAHSRLAQNRDLPEIIQLLETFDLKRDDARSMLEQIALASRSDQPRPPATAAAAAPAAPGHAKVRDHESSQAPLLIWESGDMVPFPELLLFLKMTGKFERYARAALARVDPLLTPGSGCQGEYEFLQIEQEAQSLLDRARHQWGWTSNEEAHVTMRDLGLGLNDLAVSLDGEVLIRRKIFQQARNPSDAFSKALRAALWLDGLALKREVLRCGALHYFARLGAGDGPPRQDEQLEARRTIARQLKLFRWSTAVDALDRIGVDATDLDKVVTQLALARRAALPVLRLLDGNPEPDPGPVLPPAAWEQFGLGSCPKIEGSHRFSLSEQEAEPVADQIARQMGVVRVGLVGQLDTLGIFIAQAFGQRSGWSSSFSSGKSESRSGARIGSIMEEVEIFAQDRYVPKARLFCSFADADRGQVFIDPQTLGLPYDSCYHEQLEMEWSPCFDLISGREVYVPTACLMGERQNNDILYCPRLGGKVFSSSGLGTGFSMAEAVVHAAAEYIERHAYRLSETEMDNPGAVGLRTFSFLDEATLPATPARIVSKYKNAGMCVRMVDITSEVAVPTFFARIYDDPYTAGSSMSADGFACHPDPEVALTMALLEAAQTRGGFIAGGREDYSLQARSLGRHERPRTAASDSQTYWYGNDRPLKRFDPESGFRSRDILDELAWMVRQVRRAGVQYFLVADFGLPEIQPACAVRVLLPGLETTNPMFTGRRARATLLRDLLPRHVR